MFQTYPRDTRDSGFASRNFHNPPPLPPAGKFEAVDTIRILWPPVCCDITVSRGLNGIFANSEITKGGGMKGDDARD